MTTRDMVATALLVVSAYIYKYLFGGGVSGQDIRSLIVPALWVACLVFCYCTIKAAVELHREDVATWKEYKPLIHVEGEFQRPKGPGIWKETITAGILVSMFFYIIWITWPQPVKPLAAPVATMEVFSGDRYPPGSKVHGIPWRSDLMDMWMTISNSSGIEYEDFSMSIESIAMEKQQKDVFLGFYEIAQVSGSVECRTQRDGYFYAFTLAPREGEPIGRPIDGTNLDTTTKKVRADCSRFPSATNLTFVVAVKNVSRWFPGIKIKPAAALIELRYKIKGIVFRKSDFVDIRDMGSVRVKRSEEELTRLRSQLSPGKASAITKGLGEKDHLMIMDSGSRP